MPEYTANVDGLGILRILEAVRLLDLIDKTRIYQASTSGLFGLVQEVPQKESTSFYPRSPYAVAKLYAYWITVNYREAYGIHVSNGISFNHESPKRGETFVTRKITRGICKIALGFEDCVYLGNLNSMRDWGHAKDYVKMMHATLQQDIPSDYIIASGNTTTIRDFVSMASNELGLSIIFQGEGVHEKGYLKEVDKSKFKQKVGNAFLTDILDKLEIGNPIISIDDQYFRPTEVDYLLGDSNKAKSVLGWEPEYEVEDLVRIMMLSDMQLLKKDVYTLKRNKVEQRLY